MKFIRKKELKKIIETLKNDNKIMNEARRKSNDLCVELQRQIENLKRIVSDTNQKIIDQDTEIKKLKKENTSLKQRLTKTKNKLESLSRIEVAPSIEKGNKIIEKLREEKENE